MIVIIDHFDSFVETLARYVREAGYPTHILQQTATLAEVQRHNPTALILSPGPGTPENTGITLPLLKTLDGRIPVLGVCLGHQAIAHAYGGRIGRASTPRHGKTSAIHHTHHPLFRGLSNPFMAGLYHALSVHSLPPRLAAIARNAAGDIMALAHTQAAIFGVQFHPESILTPDGRQLIGNFLHLTHNTHNT